MQESDLHYLGGVLDSDGSIHIKAAKRSRARYGFNFHPTVQVSMVDREHYTEPLDLFEDLAEEVGVNCYDERDKHGMRKVRVHGAQNVPPFLEEVLPYLRAKKEQAELVIEAPWTTRGVPMPEEDFIDIAGRRERIRKINSKTKTKYDKEHIISGVVDGEAQAD